PRFGHRTSNSLPPFPRGGFASRPSRRHRRHRYYEGSDSCRSHPDRQVSPLTPPCRPGIPTSTTRAVRRSLCQPHQRRRLLPGFALNEQARHGITPNQVRHPTDCRLTSGCSPPRLAATQLPSITEPATGSGTDSHRADKASSRTHSFPRKREPRDFSGLPPCSSQGQALGPRVRGDDELVCSQDFLTASCAGKKRMLAPCF